MRGAAGGRRAKLPAARPRRFPHIESRVCRGRAAAAAAAAGTTAFVDQRSLDFLLNFIQAALGPLETMAASPAASPSFGAALATLASDGLCNRGDANGEAKSGESIAGDGGGGDGCSTSVAGSTVSGTADNRSAFFQMCDVKPVHLCIDYLPRRPSARDVYADPSPHQLANSATA